MLSLLNRSKAPRVIEHETFGFLNQKMGEYRLKKRFTEFLIKIVIDGVFIGIFFFHYGMHPSVQLDAVKAEPRVKCFVIIHILINLAAGGALAYRNPEIHGKILLLALKGAKSFQSAFISHIIGTKEFSFFVMTQFFHFTAQLVPY